MGKIAGDVQEGLLALAVGAGLQVMAAMMNADDEAVCGPKGKRSPRRFNPVTTQPQLGDLHLSIAYGAGSAAVVPGDVDLN